MLNVVMTGAINLNGAAKACNLITGQCFYSYTIKGTILARTCNTYYKSDTLYYKYNPGDVLYLAYKAKIGKLEKVKIKDVRVVSSRKILGAFSFVYVDTLNSLYNERDLVYETDALLLAKTFYENRIIDATYAKYPCTWKRI